jgi:hypothetical protein
MSEVTRNNLPEPKPAKENEMQDRGHGDKLEHAVESIATATTPPRRPEDARGDEIME